MPSARDPPSRELRARRETLHPLDSTASAIATTGPSRLSGSPLVSEKEIVERDRSDRAQVSLREHRGFVLLLRCNAPGESMGFRRSRVGEDTQADIPRICGDRSGARRASRPGQAYASSPCAATMIDDPYPSSRLVVIRISARIAASLLMMRKPRFSQTGIFTTPGEPARMSRV